MCTLSWEYIAGFFDGEGNVGVFSNRARRGLGSPVITIAQTGARGQVLLTAISEFLKLYEIKCYLGCRKAHGNNAAQYTIRICNRAHVSKFLRMVFPYLWIKKVESQDVLRFLTVFGSIQGWYFRELNQLRSAAKARGEGYVALAVPYNHPDSLGKEGRARVKYIRSHTPKWRHLVTSDDAV